MSEVTSIRSVRHPEPNPYAPKGTVEWAMHIAVKIKTFIEDQEQSAQHLEDYIKVFQDEKGYSLLEDDFGQPFPTFESWCIHPKPRGLGYDVGHLDVIIKERKDVQTLARNAEPLEDHGNGPGRGNKRDSVTTSFNDRGSEYLTRRIARDRPDILEDMKAGKYPSVRAAAKDAGIIKDLTPLQRAQRIWLKLSEEDRQAFLDFIHEKYE